MCVAAVIVEIKACGGERRGEAEEEAGAVGEGGNRRKGEFVQRETEGGMELQYKEDRG